MALPRPPGLYEPYIDLVEGYGPTEDAQAAEVEATLLGQSHLSDLEADPEAQAAQRQALSQLGAVARTGTSAQDQTRHDALRRTTDEYTRGQYGAAMQQLDMSGKGGVGAAALLALQGGQAGANRAAQSEADFAAAAKRNALAAMGMQADAGNRLADQSFREQGRVATAEDEYSRINADVTQNQRRLQSDLQNQVSQSNVNQRQADDARKLRGLGTAYEHSEKAYNDAMARYQEEQGELTGWMRPAFGILAGGATLAGTGNAQAAGKAYEAGDSFGGSAGASDAADTTDSAYAGTRSGYRAGYKAWDDDDEDR